MFHIDIDIDTDIDIIIAGEYVAKINQRAVL
jgi:hypothetical protein